MNSHLIDLYPNKYNLTPAKLHKLIVKDWVRLKKNTWHNEAMKDTGSWWCHLEGSQEPDNTKYCDDDEFWIGFNEVDNTIKFWFSSYEGMCGYEFKKFYDFNEIDNKFDLNVQVNAIRWLNKMIDEKILGL